jgi:hypothetical protein
MTLKSNKVPYSGSGKSIDPLDAGNYPARVVQVIDLGLQAQRPFEGKAKDPCYEIMVTYELTSEFLQDDDGNDDPTKPRWVSERFGIYPLASEKAKSTKRYLTLDPKLENDGDWAAMIGKACLVAVVQNKNKSTGKIYNNVGGISPPIKGMEVPPLVNEGRVFSQDNPDPELFDSLPEWIQTIIKEGLEYNNAPAAIGKRDPNPVGDIETVSDEVPF